MLVFVVKHCLNGKLLGYTPHNLPFARDVAPLVSIVTYRSISLLDINRMVALQVFGLTLQSVLILSLIRLSGLLSGITVVTIPLLLCYLTCTIICRVVFGMLVALVLFGLLLMVCCRVTHSVLLFSIVSFVL